MLPNREGLFNAYPIDIGVSETGPNHLGTCTILYRLYEELVNGEWADCSAEGMELNGFHYLEKRDGSLNTATLDSLKEALGWDGRDPFWLQDNAPSLSGKPVQVKLGFEEFQGKNRIKVLFLNPHGSAPSGVTKGDDTVRRTINARLGAKFRALAGGTPAPAPAPGPRAAQGAPPARAKTAPPAASKPPAAATDTQPATATMEQAWETFCQEYDKGGPDKGSQDDCQKQWFEILNALFPGKQPDQLKGAEWAVVLTEAPTRIIPF